MGRQLTLEEVIEDCENEQKQKSINKAKETTDSDAGEGKKE